MLNSHKSMDFNYTFKLVMIGDAGVGKTSMMYNYVYGAPPKELKITIGVDFGCKVITIDDDQPVKLHIWDTSGQEKFRSITRTYYRGVAGCLVLYDVTSRKSFEHVAHWLRDVRDLSPNAHSVIMLVGTKTDLKEERVITTEEGEALAAEEGILFAETNFTQRPNQLFERIGKQIYIIRDLIQSGVKENIIKPPDVPRSLSPLASENCCTFFF